MANRDIKSRVTEGRLDPEASVINARLVPDVLVLLSAARCVLGAKKYGRLKTRSMHAELVFCLAASKHVSGMYAAMLYEKYFVESYDIVV